jgi:hypothetical protein
MRRPNFHGPCPEFITKYKYIRIRAFCERNAMNDSSSLSLNALSVATAARLLSMVSGERVTEEMIRADLAAGAPANTDGTINLVHYTAWLVKEMERAG